MSSKWTNTRWIAILVMMGMMATFTGCPLLDMFQKKEAEEAPAEEPSEGEHGDEAAQIFNAGPKPEIDNYRPISLTTSDGIKIVGTVYAPGLSPYKAPAVSEEGEEEEPPVLEEAEPAKVQYPLVILFHMLSGDQWEWKDVPRHLVNAGYAVLVFDMRGHGESVYQGKALRVWRQFDEGDWKKLVTDVPQVLKAIGKVPDLNMVSTQKVMVLGSSIGANVALNYAAASPRSVQAIVLLSPGLEYHGLQTSSAVKRLNKPIYFLASQEDAYAADSAQQLYKLAQGKKKIQIFQNLGHGTDMLMADSSLKSSIIDWLKRMVPPPSGPVQEQESADSKTEAPKPVEPLSQESEGQTDATSSQQKSQTSEGAKPAKVVVPGSKSSSATTPKRASKPVPKPAIPINSDSLKPATVPLPKPEPKKSEAKPKTTTETPKKQDATTKPVPKPEPSKPVTKPVESTKAETPQKTESAKKVDTVKPKAPVVVPSAPPPPPPPAPAPPASGLSQPIN